MRDYLRRCPNGGRSIRRMALCLEYVPLVKQPSFSAVIKAAMASKYLSILEVDVGVKLS